jgi:hypothetical protein
MTTMSAPSGIQAHERIAVLVLIIAVGCMDAVSRTQIVLCSLTASRVPSELIAMPGSSPPRQGDDSLAGGWVPDSHDVVLIGGGQPSAVGWDIHLPYPRFIRPDVICESIVSLSRALPGPYALIRISRMEIEKMHTTVAPDDETGTIRQSCRFLQRSRYWTRI